VSEASAGPAQPVPPSDQAEPSGAEPTHVEVGWSSFVLVAAVVVVLVVTVYLASAVQDTIVDVLLALVGALALDRVVAAVGRWLRLPRAGAVAVVLAASAAVTALIAFLLAPAVVRQGERLGRDAPAVLDRLTRLPAIGGVLRDNNVPAEAQRWLDALPERVAANLDVVAGTAQATVSGTISAVLTMLLLVLLLIEGPGLLAVGRDLLPQPWRARAEPVGRSLYVVIGRYAVGSLLLAAMAGTAAFLIGITLAVPLAALAGLWAFVWNFVPQLGGLMGGAGLVLLALTRDPSSAVVALAAWLIYMQVENRLVQPVVVGRAVQLSPLTTIVAALVGASVAGIIGTVLAVPLVAAAKAAGAELRERGRP
jgi:predicted PurR-regulated permease PerM